MLKEGGAPNFEEVEKSSENAILRLKKIADENRERRISSIIESADQPFYVEVLRILYLTICILFDGILLLEIPIELGRTVTSWVVFCIILYIAINLQARVYRIFFPR